MKSTRQKFIDNFVVVVCWHDVVQQQGEKNQRRGEANSRKVLSVFVFNGLPRQPSREG